MVPFDTEDLNGVVYVWCGSKADHEDASLTEEIAYLMYKVSTLHSFKYTLCLYVWFCRITTMYVLL